MHCELVQTQTPDLARLHGAFFRPQVARCVSLDAAILLHGLAGNFYSSRLLQSLARQLLELGIHVLQANTRGHDGLNWTSIGGRTEANGAAFELVDHCRHDISGWAEFLVQRGCQRIGLVGHSLGAIKAIYSQAHQPHAAVTCIAALSASRLNYDRFTQSPARHKFNTWIESAEQLAKSGHGRQLMLVDFPFPAFIAAEAYLDKYGPASRYDWTRFVQRTNVPILLTFGERELATNAAFDGILAEVEQLRTNCRRLEIRVIPDADHFYIGRRQVVSKTVRNWLVDLFPHAVP